MSLVFGGFYYLFYIGATLVYLSYERTSNTSLWYFIQSGGTIALFIGIFISALTLNPSNISSNSFIFNDFQRIRYVNALIGLGVGFLICSIVVYQIGNIGLQGIKSALFHLGLNVSEMRKSLTAGTHGYLAPGYLKQIRDIAFPFLVTFFFFGVRPNSIVFKVIKYGMMVTAIIFVISSGQRGPLFLFVFFVLMSWVFVANKSILNRRVIISIITLVLFISVLTYALGRSTDDMGLFDPFIRLFERIFMRLHDENIRSMPMWISYTPAYGSVQLEELSQILPGTQIGLSNYLHHYLGGSLEGNSPIQLFIALWLDFGTFGLFLIGFVLGFSISSIDILTYKRRRFLSTKLAYVYITIIITNVQSVQGLLLSGTFTLLLILLLLKIDYFFIGRYRKKD